MIETGTSRIDTMYYLYQIGMPINDIIKLFEEEDSENRN